jgi:hypothetical protein
VRRRSYDLIVLMKRGGVLAKLQNQTSKGCIIKKPVIFEKGT